MLVVRTVRRGCLVHSGAPQCGSIATKWPGSASYGSKLVVSSTTSGCGLHSKAPHAFHLRLCWRGMHGHYRAQPLIRELRACSLERWVRLASCCPGITPNMYLLAAHLVKVHRAITTMGPHYSTSLEPLPAWTAHTSQHIWGAGRGVHHITARMGSGLGARLWGWGKELGGP